MASIPSRLTSVDIDEPVAATARVNANHDDKPTVQSERVEMGVDSRTVRIVLNQLLLHIRTNTVL